MQSVAGGEERRVSRQRSGGAGEIAEQYGVDNGTSAADASVLQLLHDAAHSRHAKGRVAAARDATIPAMARIRAAACNVAPMPARIRAACFRPVLAMLAPTRIAQSCRSAFDKAA